MTKMVYATLLKTTNDIVATRVRPGHILSDDAIPIVGTQYVKMPLQTDTIERLMKLARDGESLDDIIVRVVKTAPEPPAEPEAG